MEEILHDMESLPLFSRFYLVYLCISSMNRRWTFVAILLATGCVCCMFACLPGNQSKTERVLHHVWGAKWFFLGSKKTGDSGGALTFLLKPQVPKQRWNNDTFYSVVTFWKGKHAVDLEVWWLWSFTAWVVMSVENRIIMAWIGRTFDFWVVFFLQAVKLREVLQMSYTRFRFPDVLVTTCLRLNCLLVDP